MLDLGLYQIADFTIWLNKNNLCYYAAEYKQVMQVQTLHNALVLLWCGAKKFPSRTFENFSNQTFWYSKDFWY